MSKTEAKEFDLKDIETQMLVIMQQQATANLSNFISFIAMERLGQTVTEATKFDLSSDFKHLTIKTEAAEEPETPAPEVSETAAAIKGKK